MGSSGMKRRRKSKGKGGGGSHPQHLAKVGTQDQIREEQHLERAAVADTMGLGSSPAWLKWGCLIVGALILVGAVVSLVALD
jgi:hypothetical protein